MITSREAEVLTHLAKAWSAYSKLQARPTSDNRRFKEPIQFAQDVVLNGYVIPPEHQPAEVTPSAKQTRNSRS